jgi:hypothetical protein
MFAMLLAAASIIPTADMTGGRKCRYGKGNEVIYDAASPWGKPATKIRVIWCRPKPKFEGGAWRIGGTPNPRAPFWDTRRPEDF